MLLHSIRGDISNHGYMFFSPCWNLLFSLIVLFVALESQWLLAVMSFCLSPRKWVSVIVPTSHVRKFHFNYHVIWKSRTLELLCNRRKIASYTVWRFTGKEKLHHLFPPLKPLECSKFSDHRMSPLIMAWKNHYNLIT